MQAMHQAQPKGVAIAVRRNVTLFDTAQLDRNAPTADNVYRMFFDNPANNSKNRTPGATNMQQPGQVPARSAVVAKAWAIDLPACAEGDAPSTADARDYNTIVRQGIGRVIIGQSSDARLSLFAKDLLSTPGNTEGISATNTADRLAADLPMWDPVLGEHWFSTKGDTIRIAALQTFGVQLAFPNGNPTWRATTVINLRGRVLADVFGALAQQFGRFA